MNLNKAKINADSFLVLNSYGFIEKYETKYSEEELQYLYEDTFNFFKDYCIKKYKSNLISIKPKRNTIYLELEDKNKVLKK